MGTSTSHRSPATREWDQVRELYQRPNPAPGEVVGRIVAALDEASRARLHDAAAVRCLDAVLHSGADLAAPGAGLPPVLVSSGVPALDLAASIRAAALASIAADRVASVTGALALDAVPPTVLDSLSPTPDWADFPAATVLSRYARYAREGDLSVLAGEYCGHGLERAFRYFVSRDVNDFVGGAGLPTVQEAAQLADRVGNYCRQRASAPRLRRHEQDLQEIMTLTQDQRVRELEPLARAAIESSLNRLALVE
jgi:hypothetical protein